MTVSSDNVYVTVPADITIFKVAINGNFVKWRYSPNYTNVIQFKEPANGKLTYWYEPNDLIEAASYYPL